MAFSTAESELRNMNFSYARIEEIRSKGGVSVYRVIQGDTSAILKCYDKQEDRREIENYSILSSLGIPTLNIIAHTDRALLMEDIEHSTYRLGVEADLNSIESAMLIGEWYRILHEKGREYARSHPLYDECDVITKENIKSIQRKTNTGDQPIWQVVNDCFGQIRTCVMALPRTLTYNDFYYTNMAVARNGSAALMFDYNLLGKGYVYSDIRNVCSSLGKAAQAAFLSTYGSFDRSEAVVDEVTCALTTLHFACQRSTFPDWATNELEKVKNGELLAALQHLLLTAG